MKEKTNEEISLFDEGILDSLGYKNIDYGYQKNIELETIVRLIIMDGWAYPHIEQAGEFSNQKTSIVSVKRIKYVHELKLIESVLK